MGHQPAKIPRNEKERLETLQSYQVLDTESEESFDNIVKTAAEVCETQIALISLVEKDRQWFKAKLGIDATETSREVSFCAHAILDDQPFIVEDALKDERFSDNPLVIGDPNIRFYGGIPLIAPNGHRIGSLCTIDDSPKSLSNQQLEVLDLLSKQVINLLEIRKQQRTIDDLTATVKSQEEKLTQINSLVPMAELDKNGIFTAANPAFLALTGYTEKEVLGQKHAILIPYNERRTVEYTTFWDNVQNDQINREERILGAQNRDLWLRSIYTPIDEKSGHKIIMTCTDITHDKEATLEEISFAKAFSNTYAIAEYDTEAKLTDANQKFLNLLGYEKSEILDTAPEVLFQDSSFPSEIRKNFLANPETKPVEHSESFKTKSGSWRYLHSTYSPVYDSRGKIKKIVQASIDLTDSKTQRNELQELINAFSLSCAIIEFAIDGTIIEVNDNFLSLMRYNREEIINKNHAIFVSDEEYNSDDYREFWCDLRQGHFKVGEFERFNRYGDRIWVRGAYTPVFNNEGFVYKVIKVTFDLTPSKEAEERLSLINQELSDVNDEISRQKHRFQLLSDASPLGIFRTDLEGNCTYANEKYLELSGLTLEESMAHGWLSAIHFDDKDRVEEEWFESTIKDTEYLSIHRFLRRDGKITWCQVRTKKLQLNGITIGYVGTVEDVTARVIAEERLKLATKTAQIGIWEWDLAEDLITLDDSLCKIYGLNEKVISSSTWLTSVHPEERNVVRKDLEKTIKNQKNFETIFRIVLPDYTLRYIKASGLIEKDGNGDPQRMVAVHSNITELSEAQARLMKFLDEVSEKSKQLNYISKVQEEFIVGSNSHGIFEKILGNLLEMTESQYGLIGEILYDERNKPYLKTHAITDISLNVQARALYEKYRGFEFSNLNNLFGAAILGQKLVITNSPHLDAGSGDLPNGHPHIYSFAGIPLFSDNKMIGLVGIANRKQGYDDDIIDRVQPFLSTCGNMIRAFRVVQAKEQADLELETSRAEALEATRAKSDFLASMSHELRTPMNSIIGFTERLIKKIGNQVGERELDALLTVERNAQHLLKLINDILDLSKIEAGKMSCERKNVDISRIVKGAAASLNPLADAKGLSISCQTSKQKAKVLGDATKLTQIFTNLIANSIKFTDQGSISIKLGIGKDDVHGKSATITIEDTGIGIKEEDMSKLFSKFTQLDQGENRSRGGTGLGLVITKNYVELHGGRIEVSSIYGSGTIFTVKLPLILENTE